MELYLLYFLLLVPVSQHIDVVLLQLLVLSSIDNSFSISIDYYICTTGPQL